MSPEWARRRRRQEDPDRARNARPAQRAGRHRHHRTAGSVRAAKRRHQVVDGQQLMSNARVIKTQDEISLLNTSAMMVDAAYDELYRAMRPGMRENEAVGPRQQSSLRSRLGIRRRRERDFRRALQPASARFFRSRAAPRRPGLLRHPAFLHGISHLLLPQLHHRLRIARHGGCLQALPRLSRRRHRTDSPRTHHGGNGGSLAEGAGVRLPQRRSRFALQYGHGIGLAIWEKPVISRLVSLDHPADIEPGMVFALETFWPSTDGWSAARIEEEIVVTRPGTKSSRASPPKNCWSPALNTSPVDGPLPDDARNRGCAQQRVLEMIEASAKTERVGVSD